MKKSVIVLLFSVFLLACTGIINAQDQPVPKKDTVNMDTDAKPEFYYAIEDEESMEDQKSSNSTVIIIAAVVVLAGVLTVVLVRKRKK